MAAAAAAAAGALAAVRANNAKGPCDNYYKSFWDDVPCNPAWMTSAMVYEPIDWITITCLEKGDDMRKQVVLPRSFEELKQIGVTTYGAPFVKSIEHVAGELLVLPQTLEELKEVGVKAYGAPFVRVLSEEGYEINDIRVVRDGDQIVFARQAEESIVRVTATCLEKGDAAGKLLVIPRSLEKLKEVGVKIYGAPFVRVLSEEGNEIDDIQMVRNWDRIVFASHKLADESIVRVTITCLEKDDDAEKFLQLPRSLEELKGVGLKIYGAPFVRVLSEEGNEINDIRVVRDGDRIVFASQKRAEDSTVHVLYRCWEKGDDEGKLLLLPSSIQELKGVGVKRYGAPFVRVLNQQGIEINDIRVLRYGERIVFASPKDSRVTITCPEKGDVVGKLMVLPHSFEELKWVGVKIYGVSFVRVLSKKGNEINDINMVRDNDRILFATYKGDEESNAQKWVEESNEPVKITCLSILSEIWHSMIQTYRFILFRK
ncbi:RAC-alpha serine/threonine-protein kinase [Salvia divinorum]|uniref:RAC-alpha serine/threonine-protein kinase n=1 Tax=Salvia divinorum TaxID=28513 RepID=A0ABD1GUD3_SALDI